MSSMGLVRKMSAEMGLLAFTALIGCFEASTSVRAPPTRLAIMRAPGPAPLSPHALHYFATPLQPSPSGAA